MPAIDYSKALAPSKSKNNSKKPRKSKVIHKTKRYKRTLLKRSRETGSERLTTRYSDPVTTVTTRQGTSGDSVVVLSMEERRLQVWEYKLAGWPSVEIARALNVSKSTITRDIRACLEEAREQNRALAGRWLDIQLSRNEDLRRKYLKVLVECKNAKDKIACLRAISQSDGLSAQLVGLIGSQASADRDPAEALTGDRGEVLAALADRIIEEMEKAPPEVRARLAAGLRPGNPEGMTGAGAPAGAG